MYGQINYHKTQFKSIVIFFIHIKITVEVRLLSKSINEVRLKTVFADEKFKII